AYRLCPQGVYLPVDMAKYARVSGEIMAILGDFTPLVEPVSVDEAFLDLTGTETLWGPALQAVRSIKTRIRETTRLTVAAGPARTQGGGDVPSRWRTAGRPGRGPGCRGGGFPRPPADRATVGRRQGHGQGAGGACHHDDRSAAARGPRRADDAPGSARP